MKNVSSLETLTLKELGFIASAAQVPRWSRLKKTELLARLVALGESVPTLAQALRIRDAKRLDVPCDALFSKQRDVQRVSSVPTKSVAPKNAAVPVKSKSEPSKPPVAPAPSRSTKKNPSEITAAKQTTPRSKKAAADEAKEKAPTKEASTPRRLEPKSTSKAVPQSSVSESTPLVPVSVKRSTSKSDAKKAASHVKPTVAKSNLTAPPSAPSTSLSSNDQATTAPNQPESSSRVTTLKEKMRLRKTLGRETDRTDRLVLMVCDPYWLRACWEITPRLVERVRSAMGRHWHTADPTLRLFKIIPEAQGATRREFVADVPIRGGVDNWYVDVDDPPSSFAVELGYLARDKQFFTLISSNIVETPQQSVRDSLGRFGVPTEFGAFSQRIFSGAASGFPVSRSTSFGPNDSPASDAKFASALERTYDSNGELVFPHEFQFEVDAEIVVKGTASPGVRIRVKEEPVRVKSDGTFSIRYRLPERRHVFPVVATSADGVETQTIILAVDRNTKILEPVFKEEEEE